MMKKTIELSCVSILLLAIMSSVSQASIAAGTYSGSYLDGYITVFSLANQSFGIGDISDGDSLGGWSFNSAIRTANTEGSFVNNGDGTGQRFINSIRQGESFFSGSIFDFTDVNIYTASGSSFSNGIAYSTWNSDINVWEFESYTGTINRTGYFSNDPFSYQLTGNIVLNEWVDLPNNYAKLEGVITNVTITITGEPVPAPSTFLLLGVGLCGLVARNRKVN